ncbi:MAG: proline--tRNA ligase [Thermoplasmatales archaeon]|nr:proline--tRNA ligase [Thermoplasmatales archaeon]
MKEENFSEWYNDVIERAGLSDKRYPVKGMNVWRPYGWKLMLNIDRIIREECNKRNFDEVCFPLLIPEEQFKKEKEHIKGFDEQVYWVTKAGENLLDVPLLLRPTSETAMYPMFALWVRSHSDLPLRTYQIVNTFRYETKQTRPFVRVREIHFFEAHTCHTDFEDAEHQIKEYYEILKNVAEKLCLPYILTKRPDWDKFAGAFYSVGIDTIMPSGKTLQIGSIHQYRENFSKAYDIKYEDEKGGHNFVHQTTYGMSERLVGAVIGVHGDEKGLVLPPGIAPVQIVIVPIFKKENEKTVKDECEKVKKMLKDFRVELDCRELTPGSKYYDWELKGVPLRIEIGPRDVKKQCAVFVRRDNGEKFEVKMEKIVEEAGKTLKNIEADLLKKAEKLLKSRLKKFEKLEEAKNFDGIVKTGWCGKENCGLDTEEKLDMKTLGAPVEKEKFKGKCASCGKDTDVVVYMARTY